MNTVVNLDELQSYFTGEIRENELLKFHTGFRIGGPAKVLLIPRGIEDLRLAITWVGKRCIPYQVIGNGTSVLSHPAGYDGWVIKLANVLNHIQIKGTRVYAGAGATMTALLRHTIAHSLTGLENWWGIPTTIGGWVVKMGRCKDPELDHLIQEVYVMEPDGLITRWIEPSQLFNDETQDFKRIIVEVVFNLNHGEREEIINKIQNRQDEWRFVTQNHFPMAGPVFFSTERDLTEVFVKHEVSGLRRGQAAFLGIGSGYVANLGEAAYNDVLALLKDIREKIVIPDFNLREGLFLLKSREVMGC